MTLADLITRVEQGSGSDRQLDAELCVALQYCDIEGWHGTLRLDDEGLSGLVAWGSSDKDWGICTPLTSSLDAIKALMRTNLTIDAYETHEYSDAPSSASIIIYGDANIFIEVENPDIHRAFLSATLKAIAAKEG